VNPSIALADAYRDNLMHALAQFRQRIADHCLALR